MTPYSIALLCNLMQTINFSAKKTIIKPFFTKNLLKIIEKNHYLFYLFLTFFNSITDKTVFTLTAGKSIKNSLLENPLIENKTAQHVLYLLSTKEIDHIAIIDKRLFVNSALNEFLNLTKITQNPLFSDNVTFFLRSIFTNIEVLPKPSDVIHFSSNNQIFSSLIGNIIERNLQGKIRRRKDKLIQPHLS